MAKKDKDGKWIFDEEEEVQIAMGTESRYRAMKRLRDEDRAEKRAQDCSEGKHKPKDGKCEYCGAEVKPEKPAVTKRGTIW